MYGKCHVCGQRYGTINEITFSECVHIKDAIAKVKDGMKLKRKKVTRREKMKYPKKIDQDVFMGKKCLFNGEYYRDYLKKQVTRSSMYDSYYEESIPVKWKKTKLKDKEGWITGFGYCYNGVIKKNIDERYFHADKRVNYVRVRTSPESKELKIPIENIRFKTD